MFISMFSVKIYNGRSLPSAIAMNSSYSYYLLDNYLFDTFSPLFNTYQLPQIVANGSISLDIFSSASMSFTFKPVIYLLKKFGIEKV